MKALVAAMVVLGLACMAVGKDEMERPAIDVVFCIDCSGSMGQVIEAAKQKIWAIVNELARARPMPVLRIGLYGYGNGNGPFRKYDLTEDLDEVYKNLMTFRDEGWGDEYVGLVIQRATDEMQWSQGSQVLKVIYVVGNETARQGEVDYTRSAPAAVAKGIIVNAIYCGDVDYQSATPTWRELARLADGQYMEIAANGGAVVMSTPYDDELVNLNARLNATYLAYGPRAVTAAENQIAQDHNAASFGGAVMAQRVAAKAGVLYQNAGWDLVDASRSEGFALSQISEEDLPEEVRKLPADQRAGYIQAKAQERAEVQKQIQELFARREQFVREEISKQGLVTEKALDEVIRRSIIEQAQKKGFAFEQ